MLIVPRVRSLPLSALTRLNSALEGRYVIESELGEGGMATVYLAQDLKHDRKVALKVLKPELAAVVGAERFLSEIRTTAGLQHPHILPLHDSGAADGLLYYVMPYIDGDTLRDRLEREKQLPVDEAVRIASAVAHALQAAHDEGIVHRDIKPANILLSRGEPLVSDFGIAIAVGAAGGNRLTETGLSVGTPFYMSPEQATGDQAVGPQSDTYSLAAVLCEMLTGDPPYMGSTAQAVLGQIIAGDDVSVTAKRRSVPSNVDAAVRKGLEKLPADRFSTAAEFATALADPSFSHGDAAAVAYAAGGGAWKPVSAVLALALVASLGWIATHPAPTPVVSRTAVAPFVGSGAAPWGRQTAISPDGSLWVVPDASGPEPRLAFKARESVDLTPIPGTEGAADVVFSPDGRWILYVVDQVLYKRPVVGGSAIALADGLDPARVALDWLDDGTILYERTRTPEEGFREIVRIPENGGEILQTAFLADSGVAAPIWSRGAPGAKGGLVVTCFSLLACSADRASLLLVDFETGARTIVQEGVARAWFAPTGHIVYVTAQGAVLARPVDLQSLAMADGTIPLFEGVRVGLGYADIVLGDDGTLLYAQSGAQAGRVGYELVWVDRAGEGLAVDPGQAARLFAGLTLSPDDRFLATAVDTESRRDVWVKELPDGPFQRMTGSDLRFGAEAVWSGDGQRVIFLAGTQDGSQVRATRADGSSSSHEVLMDAANRVRGVQITPDGEWLAFSRLLVGTDTAALGTLNLVTGELREEILGRGYRQMHVKLSPGGDLVAYTSNETGSSQVYVRPFPDLESRRWPVSTAAGAFPVWSRGTTEIFYVSGQDLMVAQYTTEGGFRITNRQRLFEYASRYVLGTTDRPFDVSADGQRLLMTRVPQGGSAGQDDQRLIMVQNWFEELEALAGPN